MPGKNSLNFRDKIPYLHPIMVESKKAYDRGRAVNQVHIENWIHFELALHVHEHIFIERVCYDCKSRIKREEVVAQDMGIKPHCVNCIQGPALSEVIEAWKCKFKLVRKSTKHPSGIFTLYVVHHPVILFNYIDEIKSTYELMECKVIWTHKPPQLTNLSASSLPLLGKRAAPTPTEPTGTP